MCQHALQEQNTLGPKGTWLFNYFIECKMGGSLWIVSMRRSEISRFNSKGHVIEKLSPGCLKEVRTWIFTFNFSLLPHLHHVIFFNWNSVSQQLCWLPKYWDVLWSCARLGFTVWKEISTDHTTYSPSSIWKTAQIQEIEFPDPAPTSS